MVEYLIPTIYLKDKQAFTKRKGMLKLLGSPITVCKNLKEKGYQLIHVVDLDALDGRFTNFDIYDSLTFFVNIQVECAPKEQMIEDLLSVKARVVLPPDADVSYLLETRLLVAKLDDSQDEEPKLDNFYDVILEEATTDKVKKYQEKDKRVIVREDDLENISLDVFGVLMEFQDFH